MPPTNDAEHSVALWLKFFDRILVATLMVAIYVAAGRIQQQIPMSFVGIIAVVLLSIAMVITEIVLATALWCAIGPLQAAVLLIGWVQDG